MSPLVIGTSVGSSVSTLSATWHGTEIETTGDLRMIYAVYKWLKNDTLEINISYIYPHIVY